MRVLQQNVPKRGKGKNTDAHIKRGTQKNHCSMLTILNPFHSICEPASRVLSRSGVNVPSL